MIGTFHYIVDAKNGNRILAVYGVKLFDEANEKLQQLNKISKTSKLEIITHKGIRRKTGQYLIK